MPHNPQSSHPFLHHHLLLHILQFLRVYATEALITPTMEYSESSNDYIEEYESIFTALETELPKVDRLPNFSDVIDGVLSSDAFTLHKCVYDSSTHADVVDSISLPDVFEFDDYLLDFVNNDETSMPEKMESKTSTTTTTATGEVNPLARIFRFKTKPRGRNVKRGKPATYDYLKSFWYGYGDDESLKYRSFVAVYDDDLNSGKKSEKCNVGRRKRHKSWSVPEVLKLCDGVSQLGVGKWTEIKRLFFSSIHHRSSVDLKDKWRNLLRASCKSPCVKLKGEWVKGNSSPTIPNHIIRRVKELSVTHPYPRKRQLKIKL
ncbi:unnamed protein product [Lactuca virosa]|uniref:Myb-like domain-containing protein n=1 Tax=Lactuca virosa TaxID=75947 RepID=A0AAU9PQP4_9ASTR|nr:unnamed protein product [Lactuca virosa]